jgi:hypothetical protein
MKKIIIIASVTIILLATAPVLWIYFNYFHTKPLTPQEQTLLTPDWSKVTHNNWSLWITLPDGSKQWNPTTSYNNYLSTIPDEDKAWPELINITIANEHLFDREFNKTDPVADEWGQLTQILDQPETKAIIDQLKDVLTRPVLGCGLYASTESHLHQALLNHGQTDNNWNPIPDPNPGTMDILLPAFGPLIDSTYLFKSAATYALINNDPDEFVELVNVIYSSAQLNTEYQILLAQLVKVAIESVANDLILWALEQHPDAFTDQHLATLSSTIKRPGIQHLIWEVEALNFQDTARRMVIDYGPPNPTSIDNALSGGTATSIPSSLPASQLHHSLQRLFYVHITVCKQAELRSRIPWDPSLQTSDAIYEQHKDSLSEIGRLFMGILLPKLDKAAARLQAHAQQSIGVRTLIALHRHKLRHEQFPALLSDIDSDLLDFDPMDIFTGEQLQYTLTNQSPMVYALGNDRDDDNGHYNPSIQSITTPTDADWPMFSYYKLETLYPEE